jgi:hypothetical protein
MESIARDRDFIKTRAIMESTKIVITIKVSYCRIPMVEMKGDG